MTGVLYDAQGAQTPDHPERGIARYITELGVALGRVAPGVVEAVVYDPSLPLTPPFERLRETAPLVPIDHDVVTRARVYHVGSPFELGRPGITLVPLAVRRARSRLVATLYDLIPLVFPSAYLPNPFDRLLYRRSLELVRACDTVVAISAMSARDAGRLLGIPSSRLRVIGAGAGADFVPPASIADVTARLVADQPGLRPGYVFLPTGMDSRKNWQGALQAYGRLPSSVRRAHQLVLTCRVDAHQRAAVAALAAGIGIADDVLMTGVVDDATLVRLYQAARVVLFPSRYEGFGLPVLEARLCGAPVICGDNSSLTEVLLDPEARFDADDATAISATLARALTDDGYRERLRTAATAPFTWDHAARETAAVYGGLLADPRARGRRRIGIVATGQPAATAASGATVTRFCPLPEGASPDAGTVSRALLPVYDTAGALDAVWYLAGDDGLDAEQLRLRAAHPGEVVSAAEVDDRVGRLAAHGG